MIYISESNWELNLERSTSLLATNYAQSISAISSDWKYGIEKGDTIGIEHILAITFYCNFDDLQKQFTQTYRAKNKDEPSEDIVDKHCKNFYHFGRFLYAAIKFFGEKMDKNIRVYHGLNKIMVFESFSYFAAGPTSTSIDKTIAHNFSQNDGIVLELKCRVLTEQWRATYFNCEVFSDYPNEKERLFLQSQLIIDTVIDTKSMKDYCTYFKIFQWLQMIVEGWSIVKDGIYNTKRNLSKKNQKILAKLIKRELSEDKAGGDKYANALFHHWCLSQCDVNFRGIHKLNIIDKLSVHIFKYDVKVIDVYKIQKLFPNLIYCKNVDGKAMILSKVNKETKDILNHNQVLQTMEASPVLTPITPSFNDNHAADDERIPVIELTASPNELHGDGSTAL